MLAIALSCRPKLLIADEPTTALDVTIQAQILDLMRDLQARTGAAIILITHDLGVVAEMAQRVVVMYAGRKVEDGAVEDIFLNPRHPYTRGLLGAVPKLGFSAEDSQIRRRLTEIPGAVPNKVSFNTVYTWTVPDGKLSLSGSIIWKDATYDAVFNRPYNLQPPYDQVNLLLNFADAQGRFNVIVFADNIFNSIGYDGSAGALLGTTGTGATAKEDILTSPFLTAPRTFGIQLQYRWK